MGLPFLQSFSAPSIKTATKEIGGILSNATQAVVNYDFASAGQKVAEAVNKLVKGGDVKEFSSATRGIGIEQIGSNFAAVDELTGKALGILGNAPLPTPPSALVSGAQDDRTNQLKVILKASPGGSFAGSDSNDEITLKVMPRISERRDAQYESFTPIHHPGVIQKYKGTNARTWSISGRLVSRTSQEAQQNLGYINLIRAWLMPFYGEGTAGSQARKYLGVPPPIITLTAYGSKMIGPVKTVLTDYNWEFPNDVDYIATIDKEPFPVILDISLSLVEAWSPAEYSNFNIIQYRKGELSGPGSAFK